MILKNYLGINSQYNFKLSSEKKIINFASCGSLIHIKNNLDTPIIGAAFVAMQRVVYNDSINISPGATSAIKLNQQSDSNLRNVISSSSEAIRASIQSRNRAFGSTELSRIDPNLMNIVTGSFPGVLELDGINKFKKPSK